MSIISKYKEKIRSLIFAEINRDRKKFNYIPTMFGRDDDEYRSNLKIAFEIKQEQMKEGIIAQIAIGNWPGWEDLKTGHESGCDAAHEGLGGSVIMEIKNKYNTVKGSDIKKSLLPTLAKYRPNDNMIRVWAIVNPKNNISKKEYIDINNKKISKESFKGVYITKLQGMELFKFVFQLDGVDYSAEIIDFIKQCLVDSRGIEL
jgi:hypothetical protein